MKMNEEIQFLKELQIELKTQDNDCQAAPRFWAVGDYRKVTCWEDQAEEWHIGCPNREWYEEINTALKYIEDEEWHDLTLDAQESFQEIVVSDDSALEWFQEHYDEDAYLIPVKEEHFVREDTMFLTKAEAKRHIELNHYHYSSKAHTYAMTAWRAPKVERLLKILETFDWDSMEK